MATEAFCTQCGERRAEGARFCTKCGHAHAPGAQLAEPGVRPAAPTPAVNRPAPVRDYSGLVRPAILTMIGGILVAAGSLLPWATISSGFGVLSVNGIEGDGVFTLAIGGGVTLLGYLEFAGGGPRWGPGAAFVLSLAGLALGLFEYTNISGRVNETDSEFLRASVGIGVYLILVGAAVALFGAWRRRRWVVPRPPA